ncbi:mucin-2-like [Mercenaria mercenaria]|uniref:mucin-2-like n=1 Tax=Mercenaria mercenaria TaxID=6596 RepID=UPI00234F9E28|nr:mucin-2-like [Mercenaria mercenaria]
MFLIMNSSPVSLILIIIHIFCINGTSGWLNKCWNKGTFYNEGDTFGRTYNLKTDTCRMYKCFPRGKIRLVITHNCHGSSPPTTPTRPPPTTPATTVPTTTPLGCLYNGQFYPPGTEISSGRTGNWCYFTQCTLSGQVVSGDDFNCGTTTTPTTTVPATTPLGCYYNGKFYPPGTEISSGRTGKWCYFTHCTSSGEVISGDDFNCGTTTPTTSPQTPESSTAKRSLRILEQEIKALMTGQNKHQH